MKIVRSLQDPLLPLRNTAVALGIFDGVHAGHQAVLQKAAEAARENRLTPCAFTFALSEPPMQVKEGAARLASPRLMEKLLDRLGMEYAVAPSFAEMRGMTGEEFVRFLAQSLGARFVCCGYDFAFGRGRANNAADLCRLAEQAGIACAVVPQVSADGERVSSTRIREHIAAGDMPGAAALLGRPFTIDFRVVLGNRIGRTLGSPTINQPFPKDFAIPRYGVYATIAWVDGVLYSGVTNVGIKPTVGSDVPLAETYLQGFSGDLYGRKIEVAFLEFIRPETKFASIEELRENIFRNADTAAEIVRRYGARHPDPLKQQNAGEPVSG